MRTIYICFVCIISLFISNLLPESSSKKLIREISSISSAIENDQIEYVKLMSHNNTPKYVFVAAHRDSMSKSASYKNTKFFGQLIKIIYDINKQLPQIEKIKLIAIGDKDFRPEISAQYSLDVVYKVLGESTLGYDQWLQDFGKFAMIKTKSNAKATMAIIESPRDSEKLLNLIPELREKFNISSVRPDTQINITTDASNYGGNYDVTPNDIMYIGQNASSTMKNFFYSRGYKNNLLELDTSWLHVGHVDEYISIIVNEKDSCGFSILKASPMVGLKLLSNDLRNDDILYSGNYSREISAIKQLNAILKNVKIEERSPAGVVEINKMSSAFAKEIISYQQKIESLINLNVRKLASAINIKSSCQVKIINMPVIFSCNFELKQCSSVLPDVINMLNLGKSLIIPDPYFRPFNEYIESTLSKEGQVVYFADDLDSYHRNSGEIHCGTNVFRYPNKFLLPIK